jgi:glycosyltransferase involved in cell wall biosynthesis
VKVSIIVPTYNRCESLKSLLESLKGLWLPDAIKCEVVVIDNNSTDGTKSIIEDYLSLKEPKIRYIFEGKQGKSKALNAGIRQAEGDIIVFTDDDCIPASDWIICIANEFLNDPSISVLGGRVELYDKMDKPITICSFEDKTFLFSPTQLYFPPLIIGCNMAVRRKVFEEVGEFDPLLGPGTKSGAVAEDIDFLYRAYKKKFKILSTPKALVFHNHGRKTEAEVNAALRGYFIGRGAFYCKYLLRADLPILKMAFREVYSDVKTLTKGFILGKNFSHHKFRLRSLLFGVFSYLKSRAFGRVSENLFQISL